MLFLLSTLVGGVFCHALNAQFGEELECVKVLVGCPRRPCDEPGQRLVKRRDIYLWAHP